MRWASPASLVDASVSASSPATGRTAVGEHRRHHQGPPDRGGRAALRRAGHRRGQPPRDQQGLGGPQRDRGAVPLRGPRRCGAGDPRQARPRRRGAAQRHARPVRGRRRRRRAAAGRGPGPAAGGQARRPRRRARVPADPRRPAQPAPSPGRADLRRRSDRQHQPLAQAGPAAARGERCAAAPPAHRDPVRRRRAGPAGPFRAPHRRAPPSSGHRCHRRPAAWPTSATLPAGPERAPQRGRPSGRSGCGSRSAVGRQPASSLATSVLGATWRKASSQMAAISSQSGSRSRRTPIQPRWPT
jgi:hypothetical protein